MNSDKVLIVVLLVIGIVVLSNLAMFAMVRGSRGMKFDWFKNIRGSVSQPFKSEDDSLDELRQRVGELEKSDEKDEE
jgi:hypothetical protein